MLPNYRDEMFRQMMEQLLFPQGRSSTDQDGVETLYDPRNIGASERRGASMASSMQEDAALRGQLGSSRSVGENEKIPRGIYAAAEYPDLFNVIDKMASMPGGVNPQGYFGYMTKEQRELADKKNRNWAANQRALLQGGNFVSRIGGR